MNCLMLLKSSIFHHGRITEGILNPSRENRKKLNSTFAMEREKIGAIVVLVDA